MDQKYEVRIPGENINWRAIDVPRTMNGTLSARVLFSHMAQDQGFDVTWRDVECRVVPAGVKG